MPGQTTTSGGTQKPKHAGQRSAHEPTFVLEPSTATKSCAVHFGQCGSMPGFYHKLAR